jgi:hypothetical protein
VSAVLLILIGCARTGLRFPGPLDHLSAPPPVSALPPEDPDTPDPLRAYLRDPLEEALSRSPAPAGDPARQELVVSAARAMLDRRNIVIDGERVRHDCIGMVAAAYSMGGVTISQSISDLYDEAIATGVAHSSKRPRPGDIVFFDNSYDKNDNGVRDDPLTHVAIVERVDAEGTITMIHLGGKGKPVARTMMNLYHPDDARDDQGNTINSTLRSVHGRDGGPELTSQLFRGFGSLWRLAEEDDDSRGP